MPEFIPVGRTSLARRGETALQVQTEYAARPNPRIATTISENGRVIHKVERPLERQIMSAEEQRETEAQMRQQHASVVATIEGKNADQELEKARLSRSGLPSLVAEPPAEEKTQPPSRPASQVYHDNEPTIISRAAIPEQPTVANTAATEPKHATLSFSAHTELIARPFAATHRPPEPEESAPATFESSPQALVRPDDDTFSMKKNQSDSAPAVSLPDRLRRLSGVQRIVALDVKGKFIDDDKTTAEFRKLFAPLLKNVRELLAFFVEEKDGSRERGFYAVDPGRLYLVSSGEAFFFVLVYAAENPQEVEQRIRDVI